MITIVLGLIHIFTYRSRTVLVSCSFHLKIIEDDNTVHFPILCSLYNLCYRGLTDMFALLTYV